MCGKIQSVLVFNFVFKISIVQDNSAKIEDEDVYQERRRIENNESEHDVLVAKNLTKRYRFVAKRCILIEKRLKLDWFSN